MFFDRDEEEEQAPEAAAPVKTVTQPRPQIQHTAAVDSFLQEQEESDAVDGPMSEVERRLLKAQFYMAVRDQKFFTETSEMAAEVESELRAFVRQRLEVLVGVTPTPEAVAAPRNQFSDEVFGILLELGTRMLENSKLMPQPKEEKRPPQLNQVQAPAKPALRQVAAPVKVKATQATTPQPQKKPAPQQKKKTGEKLVVDGVTYEKFVDAKLGEYYVGPNNHKYKLGTVQGGDNDGLPFMQNISTQAQPTGVKPAPAPTSKQQMENQAQQHAAAVVNQNQRQMNSILSNIVQETLK